ncbi:hypothetical protein [Candidatus Nitrosocosmicus franklandus]|uniref:hypothetical protein n=1 Tax=Candidatus Nitrosocosmicus franklandianus TaxID=1798806 RepID=UPI00106966D1|nr:hypothetical protein [Candidatus Nitrosocosmicus franklandus]
MAISNEVTAIAQRSTKDKKAITRRLGKISVKNFLDSMYLSKMQLLLEILWGEKLGRMSYMPLNKQSLNSKEMFQDQ